jgi:hypothetical protein
MWPSLVVISRYPVLPHTILYYKIINRGSKDDVTTVSQVEPFQNRAHSLLVEIFLKMIV